MNNIIVTITALLIAVLMIIVIIMFGYRLRRQRAGYKGHYYLSDIELDVTGKKMNKSGIYYTPEDVDISHIYYNPEDEDSNEYESIINSTLDDTTTTTPRMTPKTVGSQSTGGSVTTSLKDIKIEKVEREW